MQVLVLEAGSRDLNPLIHVPGGVGMLAIRTSIAGSERCRKPAQQPRIRYPQGEALGSSAINSMIYIRGPTRGLRPRGESRHSWLVIQRHPAVLQEVGGQRPLDVRIPR